MVLSRELPIYRIEQGLRGSEVVDMGAASPAAGRARRGYGDALRVQAVLLAATAWSGSAGIARIASVSVAPAAEQGLLLRRRWARVVVLAVSGGVQVASGGSTRRELVQGVSEMAARRVYCDVRVHVMRGASGVVSASRARVGRRVSSSSVTTARLGWRRRCVGARWRGGQGWEAMERGGGRRARGHGRHGHALACSLLSSASLCIT